MCELRSEDDFRELLCGSMVKFAWSGLHCMQWYPLTRLASSLETFKRKILAKEHEETTRLLESWKDTSTKICSKYLMYNYLHTSEKYLFFFEIIEDSA